MESSEQPITGKGSQNTAGGEARAADVPAEETESDRSRGFLESWMQAFKSRAAIVILGFFIGAIFIFFTLKNIKWNQVYEAFQHGQWLPWLPLAVLTYIFGMFLRGYRLKLLVRDEATISIGTASNIVAVGYATNNILPARLGEFARAGMLAERTGLPYLLTLTVTLLERLLDGLVILFLFVVSSFMVPVDNTMHQWTGIAAMIFLLAMLSVGLITMTPHTMVAIVSNLTSGLNRKWHGKAIALITQVNRGFGCLRNGRSALLILFSSFLVWVVESLFFMLVMPCFALPLGFIRAVVTMSVTNLGILIPSTPGYVGPYHYICQQTLMKICSVPGLTPGTVDAITVDGNVAFLYAVVVHLVFYVTVTVWGVLALARYSMEVGSTAALAWEAKPITIRQLPDSHHESVSLITSYPELSPKVIESVTKFWSGLCECFIPEDHRLEDAEEFQKALRQASTFTVTELQRLPFRLRIIFETGITVFKALVVMSTGRFLCDMPIDQRRKLVNAWAFRGCSLNRKFMKPIRSLSLFAYYENADVQRQLDGRGGRPTAGAETGSP